MAATLWFELATSRRVVELATLSDGDERGNGQR
jgi:hypothetical protein